MSNKILAAIFWIAVLLITATSEQLAPHFETIFWGATLLAGVIMGFEGVADALNMRKKSE